MASSNPVASSDNLVAPRPTKGKRRNSQAGLSLNLPRPPALDDLDTNAPTTSLSPPPTPKRPSHKPRLSLGLRSNSGLSLHTNQAAFRQYTNYGSGGTMRSPALPLSPRLLPDFLGGANSTPGSNRTSIAIYDDLTPPYSPPVLDFFHRDVVQMVLHNPATAQRLCKFAQTRNRRNEMEFLVKVDEYSRALSNLTSLIAHISTTFSSVTALSPLGLPPEVGTVLASNLKNFNKQMLPVLERLFREAKNAVEKRISKEIYPDFVKYQLIQCVQSSLSVSKVLTREFQSAYPGLGNSFILTDPLYADNPIVYASDGFSDMTGYSRAEVMRTNCRFLQGLVTDRSPGQRIREAVSLGHETTQLMLNYRKDGSAFWNLLYICPLQEQGRVRYCLGAQINVSENVGSHYKDILRILDFGTLPGEGTSEKETGRREKTQRKSPERRVERVLSSRDRDDRQRSQRSRFFKSFTRKPGGPTPARGDNPKDLNTEDELLPKMPMTPKSETSLAPSLIDQICAYPQLLVMRYLPGLARSPQLDRRGSVPAPSMPVAFCSAAVLELFGLESYEKEVVLDQDIFSVLADQGGSPTINKTLKAAIRDKMTAGEMASADLLVNAEPPVRQSGRQGRKNSIMSLSGRSRDAASVTDWDGPAIKGRKSETLERSAELVSNALFGHKMRKLISHWTPLKDAEGTVSWVVLVMSPASS